MVTRRALPGRRGERKGRAGDGAFPVTHWSVVLAVRGEDTALRGQALDFLCERYWKPVYCYIRRCGCPEEEAKDLVQGFFTDCLARHAFAKADPARGRFRNFLLRSLQHFMANEHRAAHAIKRRPEGGIVDIDDLPAGISGKFTAPRRRNPEEVYYRAWSITLIQRALHRLEGECRSTGKLVHYEIFSHRIVLPVVEGIDPPSLRELAARLRVTEKEASNCLLIARRAYRRLLVNEIRDEVANEREADGELRDLLHFISDSRA